MIALGAATTDRGASSSATEAGVHDLPETVATRSRRCRSMPPAWSPWGIWEFLPST